MQASAHRRTWYESHCGAGAHGQRTTPSSQEAVVICDSVGIFRCLSLGCGISRTFLPSRKNWIKWPWHVSNSIEESSNPTRVMPASDLVMLPGGSHACAWRRMAGPPMQGDVLRGMRQDVGSIGGEGCAFVLNSAGTSG